MVEYSESNPTCNYYFFWFTFLSKTINVKEKKRRGRSKKRWIDYSMRVFERYKGNIYAK